MDRITLILDTREQDGLDFSKFRDVDVARQGLKTGDYSIQGYEDEICFERKSVPDLVGTLIGDHSRFLKEIERMKSFEEKYILVEHTAGTVYRYCERKGWENKFDIIIQSLLAYACHCGIRVRFCKNRDEMSAYIVRKSKEFLKGKNDAEKNTTTENQI